MAMTTALYCDALSSSLGAGKNCGMRYAILFVPVSGEFAQVFACRYSLVLVIGFESLLIAYSVHPARRLIDHHHLGNDSHWHLPRKPCPYANRFSTLFNTNKSISSYPVTATRTHTRYYFVEQGVLVAEYKTTTLLTEAQRRLRKPDPSSGRQHKI